MLVKLTEFKPSLCFLRFINCVRHLNLTFNNLDRGSMIIVLSKSFYKIQSVVQKPFYQKTNTQTHTIRQQYYSVFQQLATITTIILKSFDKFDMGCQKWFWLNETSERLPGKVSVHQIQNNTTNIKKQVCLFKMIHYWKWPKYVKTSNFNNRAIISQVFSMNLFLFVLFPPQRLTQNVNYRKLKSLSSESLEVHKHRAR